MMKPNKRVIVSPMTLGQKLKDRWHKEGKGLSLKQFARKLLAAGDKVAEDWFNHKKGYFTNNRF